MRDMKAMIWLKSCSGKWLYFCVLAPLPASPLFLLSVWAGWSIGVVSWGPGGLGVEVFEEWNWGFFPAKFFPIQFAAQLLKYFTWHMAGGNARQEQAVRGKSWLN